MNLVFLSLLIFIKMYTIKTGKYDSMSAKSKADYKEHLVEFYKAFTEMIICLQPLGSLVILSYVHHSTPNCKPDVGLNKIIMVRN